MRAYLFLTLAILLAAYHVINYLFSLIPTNF